MELEVTPEPTPEEREAIARALARLISDSRRENESAWRRAAVSENVESDEPDLAR